MLDIISSGILFDATDERVDRDFDFECFLEASTLFKTFRVEEVLDIIGSFKARLEEKLEDVLLFADENEFK
jgi:hypothetical protein